MTPERGRQISEASVWQMIADRSPWTRSSEGLDDYCYWCGCDVIYENRKPGEIREPSLAPEGHDPEGCVWVTCKKMIDALRAKFA